MVIAKIDLYLIDFQNVLSIYCLRVLICTLLQNCSLKCIDAVIILQLMNCALISQVDYSTVFFDHYFFEFNFHRFDASGKMIVFVLFNVCDLYYYCVEINTDIFGKGCLRF